MSQPLRWGLVLHRKTAPNSQVQAPILNRDIQPTQESPIISPDFGSGRGLMPIFHMLARTADRAQPFTVRATSTIRTRHGGLPILTLNLLPVRTLLHPTAPRHAPTNTREEPDKLLLQYQGQR